MVLNESLLPKGVPMSKTFWSCAIFAVLFDRKLQKCLFLGNFVEILNVENIVPFWILLANFDFRKSLDIISGPYTKRLVDWEKKSMIFQISDLFCFIQSHFSDGCKPVKSSNILTFFAHGDPFGNQAFIWDHSQPYRFAQFWASRALLYWIFRFLALYICVTPETKTRKNPIWRRYRDGIEPGPLA